MYGKRGIIDTFRQREEKKKSFKMDVVIRTVLLSSLVSVSHKDIKVTLPIKTDKTTMIYLM